jgi:hypothetical protein
MAATFINLMRKNERAVFVVDETTPVAVADFAPAPEDSAPAAPADEALPPDAAGPADPDAPVLKSA